MAINCWCSKTFVVSSTVYGMSNMSINPDNSTATAVSSTKTIKTGGRLTKQMLSYQVSLCILLANASIFLKQWSNFANNVNAIQSDEFQEETGNRVQTPY